jgi:hypothetical protein
MDTWRQEQARKDRGMALVAWVLMQVHRSEHAPSIEFPDVMAMLGHREVVPEPPLPTPEELAAQVKALHDLYAARDGLNGVTGPGDAG